MDIAYDHQDELYMHRALELALMGTGKVSPNPRVGCVIVAKGKIIGEGWHQQYGGPHAEVNAIASVDEKHLLKDADVYVTLEPCAHHGKTPPCADLLIEHKVGRVVVSVTDPNPLVNGRGVRKLLNSGIIVMQGCLQAQARELNKGFFAFMEKRRPYIILKWAQTADRFIARLNGDSKWISSYYSRKLVHQWRAAEDAVMVGPGTAIHDNPLLTVREWSGRNPIRVVMDRYGRLPRDLHLFNGDVMTICYNTIMESSQDNLKFVKLDEARFFEDLIADLYKRNVQSLIVEGGRQTLELFIAGAQWDEARIFTSSGSFDDGVAAPLLKGALSSREIIGTDLLEIFTP